MDHFIQRVKNLFLSSWGSKIIYWIIRLYSATFRFKVENQDEWLKLHDDGKTVLLSCWHQQFFPAIHHFRRYKERGPGLMISKSKDGGLIAGVANLCGWRTPRGSSSKDGKKALLQMMELIGESRLAGHVADGPRGPIGVLKAGAIKLAHDSNAVIVPFHTTVSSAWIFNSWDRFIIPKPLARVTLVFQKPIQLDPTCATETFEQQRERVEKAMVPYLK